jgi:hypothetical protein
MTNENQKKFSLKKYKFLVPQVVNLAFIIFVCSVANVGQNNGFIVLFIMFSIFSAMLSIHFYKIESNEEYAEDVLKEKSLPWNKRAGSYQIRTGLEDLSLILWVCIAFFIFEILRNFYYQKYANGFVLLFLGSFIFVLAKIIGKFLRKFFSKK